MRQPSSRLLNAAVVGLALGLLAMVVVLLAFIGGLRAEGEQALVRKEAEILRATLQMHVAGEQQQLMRLAAAIAAGTLDPEGFRVAGRALLSQQHHIRRVVWLDAAGHERSAAPTSGPVWEDRSELAGEVGFTAVSDLLAGPAFLSFARVGSGGEYVVAEYSPADWLVHIDPGSLIENGHTVRMRQGQAVVAIFPAETWHENSVATLPLDPPGHGLVLDVGGRTTLPMPLMLGTAGLALLLAAGLVFALRAQSHQLEAQGRAAELALESEQQYAALVAILASANDNLAVIARCQNQFIAGEPHAGIFQDVLDAALRQTGSSFGFVGEVHQAEGGEPWVLPRAISDIAWDQASREMLAQSQERGFEFGGADTLIAAAIRSREPVISNDPERDPRSGGLPPGHPALTSFLGVPLHVEAQLVGLIGLANRPEGYDTYVVRSLEPLLATVATLIAATRLAAERAEAERRRHASEERYRLLVQSLDAIVWEADAATFDFRFVSEPARRILGYAPEEWSTSGFWAAHIHPEDRETTVEACLTATREGRDHELVYRMCAADGRDVWLHDVVRVITAPDGRPQRLSGVMLDVTATRRLQQALTAAAEEWVATFDAMEAAVVVLDAEGRIKRMNAAAARVLGRPWSETLLEVLSDVAPGEPWITAGALAAEAKETGRSEARRVQDPEGNTWELDAVRAAALAGDESVILSLREVTHLVELQESVRRAENLAVMGTLVAGLAHAVRNPLFAISANVDALLALSGDKQEYAESLHAVAKESLRLSRLMEDLLLYGRPAPVARQAVPLEPALQAAVSNSASVAAQHEITIVRRGHARGVQVHMTPSQIEEVVGNLLENACQHSLPGSSVVLEVGPHQDAAGAWVRIQVDDSGCGFSPELLPHVFEPFVTSRKGGTGLGLAIVQRFVLEHGGQVRAANDPQGGAVVVVDLPLAAEAAR